MEPPQQACLQWIKASQSYASGACVELAPAGNMIMMRDSKNPMIHLCLTPQEISAFLDGVKKGEFDHLVG
jgi:Domain of unknown function (DUF397)